MSLKQIWGFTTGTAGVADANPHNLTAGPQSTAGGLSSYLGGIQIRNGANACTITIKDAGGNVIWADSLSANERMFATFEPGIGPSPGAITYQASATGAIINAQGWVG